MRGTSTRRRYGATPTQRWMNIYRHGKCRICDKSLNKGDRAFWDGSSQTLTCTDRSCIDTAGIVQPLVVTRFSSGAVQTRNANGLCEDAPCCGCCT